MYDYSIETQALQFRFGTQQVVDNVSLQVPKGSIYGFLGPNGAGKTTTIKLLLNLLRTREKNIYLFGQELNAKRVGILSRVGSLVEQPAIYGHLSGRENLTNRAMLLGVPKKNVQQLLKLVDLEQAAEKKASNYSLGMKQRLGIALALLADPELLILDEPTNGLDPNGIIEVRELLQDLAQNQGKTIFVSSHLLAEVEKMATHVGIINKGKLLFQGSIHELHALNASLVRIGVDRLAEAGEFLTQEGFLISASDGFLNVPFNSQEEMGRVNTLLVNHGFTVFSLQHQRKDLENLFLDITKN
ncbi:ABC transporter ATP-binding protein [Parapedobacter tibetensis]|uniref:ABC transporter ATP-binding protein n=1 Tax=Parapedobacter tibetensis TaxID=2972951 RepID=UPI00214D286D|nr:ABC transporter ATP-binding protein [Parapedobacter tibetensis]